nr:MAG TPA: hypothetical protein [Caudoviricetes sp.]
MRHGIFRRFLDLSLVLQFCEKTFQILVECFDSKLFISGRTDIHNKWLYPRHIQCEFVITFLQRLIENIRWRKFFLCLRIRERIIIIIYIIRLIIVSFVITC